MSSSIEWTDRYEPAGPGYSYPIYAAQDGTAEPEAPVPGFVCHRCGCLVAHRSNHDEHHAVLDHVAGLVGGAL